MVDRPIFGLGLCSGALGLELGLEIAISGYRSICVVEREIAVAGRVAARVSEGSVPELAQWDDLANFQGRVWRGVVHIVSAGFPCQPFSVAGKRKGTGDERWIWPHIARIIGEVQPDCVFLENVPGLLLDPDSDVDRWELEGESEDALGGMGTVLRDLAQLGFDAEWCCLRASDVGASHGRKRVFILAYRDSARRWWDAWQHHGGSSSLSARSGKSSGQMGYAESSGQLVAHDISERLEVGGLIGNDSEPQRAAPERSGDELGDPASHHEQPDRQCEGRSQEPLGRSGVHVEDPAWSRQHGLIGEDGGIGRRGVCEASAELEHAASGGTAPAQQSGSGSSLERASRELPIFAPGPNDPSWPELLVRFPWLRPSISQAEAERYLRDDLDGLARLVVGERTGALRALGNGVVALQAAVAFTELVRRCTND